MASANEILLKERDVASVVYSRIDQLGTVKICHARSGTVNARDHVVRIQVINTYKTLREYCAYRGSVVCTDTYVNLNIRHTAYEYYNRCVFV